MYCISEKEARKQKIKRSNPMSRGKARRKWIFRRMIGIILVSILLSASPGSGQENLPALIKKVEPSIVVVVIFDSKGEIRGQGTGFFVDSKGDVITNFHVLREASRAKIFLSTGENYPIQNVIAADPEGDLIRVSVDIPREKVKALPIRPTPPEVGEKIIVIGTPMGLDKTVSDGIVSAVREVPEFGKLIQLTAPISQGSSGSPVLNMKGEVIGVATFYLAAGQNLNFAVPAGRIIRMADGPPTGLTQHQEKLQKKTVAEAEETYLGGLRHVLNDQCDRALPYFIEAIQQNPRHAQAHARLGYCLIRLGKYRESIPLLQKTIELQPRSPKAHNNLCLALGQVGRYDEAILSCKQAIVLQKDLAEAYNNLGWNLLRLDLPAEAIESCKEAIRLEPDLAAAHYNLGNGYAAQKRYGEAAEAYKQAIRLEPDYAEAHLNLGAAYDQLGKRKEAVDSYKRALRIKPLLPEARLNLGMAYLQMGDKGSAIEEYKILKDLDREKANKLFHLIYE
jgi:S1-C subfamily serine protease/Flp pilus assembly protein TadD